MEENEKGDIRKLRTEDNMFEVTDDALLITERDGMNKKVAGKIGFGEIESIEIKPAGTLYKGEVVFNIKGGSSLKYKINNYQQQDFEEFKMLLGK